MLLATRPLVLASLFAALALAGPLATAAHAADPMVAAAGDIACDSTDSRYNGGNGNALSCRQKWTSNLLVGTGLSGVIALGDNQYWCGSLTAYGRSYDLTWGRVKAITHPTPGNHEYLTSGATDCDATNAGAAGYFNYFAAAAGTVAPNKGYYSYDVGSWHLVSLNSQCSAAGGCSTTSPQGKWLAADLAAHPVACTIAYWHVPLYSSGGRATAVMKPLYQILYDNQADIVLAGHDHMYERFAPQDANAHSDPAHGIREWVVGTGGANHTSIVTVAPNSEARNGNTYGVLRVTLHPTGYDYTFLNDPGSGTFTESGSGACHDGPVTPAGLAATTPTQTETDLTWTAAAARANPVASYRIYRDGAQIGTSATPSYVDRTAQAGMTYGYSVDALDTAGQSSPLSSGLSVKMPAPPDSIPPTAPGNLAAQAVGPGEIDLTWTAATDNVGVAGYRIFRGVTQVAAVGAGTLAYADRGLTPSTSYSYTVYAVDAAGNLSPASNVASATTQADTTPPTAPTNVAGTAASSSQIGLTWTASTDNVAVASYRIFRDGGQVGTSTGTAFTDTGLAASTAYTYTVSAVDTAGNVSPLSAPVTVTTLATGLVAFGDGFESGDLSAWTSTTGNLVAEQSLVFGGLWAARMTSAGVQTFATKTLGTTYTEASYSTEFQIVSLGANNVNLIKVRTAANVAIGGAYVTSAGMISLRNDVASVSTMSKTLVTQGVWHLLKLHVIVGGTTGSLSEVWLDGVKIISATDTLGTAGVGILQLGENSNSRTYDVAFDDVQVTSP